MRKFILAPVIIILMALVLTACGGTPSTSLPEPSTENDQPEEVQSFNVGICQLLQHDALDAATKGFRDALTSKLGDRVRFDEQNANGEPDISATICNQFVSSGVDLIMANATPALQAAQTSTNKIPILGTSVTDYGTALGIDDWTGKTGKNISGTSDLAPLDQQAVMLNEIFPDAQKVGIIYCSAEPNSKYQDNVITEHLVGLGYSVKSYTFSDSNDLQTVAKAAVSESDVIYLPTDNTVASNTEIIKNVSLPAKVPIIAGEEGICSGCGVATLSISYYDLGYTTGEMAYEILVNGAEPATMDIKYAPKFTKKYNPDICDTLGITLSDEYEAL